MNIRVFLTSDPTVTGTVVEISHHGWVTVRWDKTKIMADYHAALTNKVITRIGDR